MNCTIDIGNTLIKVGYFKNEKLVETKVCKNENELIEELSLHTISKVIISSVGKYNLNLLEDYNPIILNHTTKTPIDNKYATPKTLGIDRLAAVIGANVLFPNQDVLIIDAGTCITYDYLNSDSQYLGGAISPGIKMKFKALHNFTSKLPLIETISEIDLIGDSTKKSIMSGVINGTISEILGIIDRYKNISDNFALVFCGGDAKFISSMIDNQSVCEENLVLIGLNKVLKINE